MEKNTVIGISLIAVIFVVWVTYVNWDTARRQPEPGEQPQQVEEQAEEYVEEPAEEPAPDVSRVTAITPITGEGDEPAPEVRMIRAETDYYDIIFSTAGGVIKHLNLKEHRDGEKPVSMVLDGETDAGTFNLAFGGPGDPYVTEPFEYKKIREGQFHIHRFTRSFNAGEQAFTLSKRYRIIPGEYMIELMISMETPDGEVLPLMNADNHAYTLTYGPQIGPEFEKLDPRYEFRLNRSLDTSGRGGRVKKTTWKAKEGYDQTENQLIWAGIIGKYFGVIADPGSGSSLVTWDTRPADGVETASRLQITKPARRSSRIEDTYRFYVGPLEIPTLKRYNDAAENAFSVSGLHLDQAPNAGALPWLQVILKVVMEFFYNNVAANWGVAILLLTVVLKLALFPITHKSYESTSKMQGIQPQMKELQAKYKDDKVRLNKEMSELYKKEGVNPMGGCLPLLLQMPILFALFGLINNYFPLRGAIFISGWITDLSSPEAVYTFEKGIRILGLELNAIRLLPIIYLGTQFLTTKVTQAGQASGQSGTQQKMMTYGLPILFFFILYNMPSGLLLYWTGMNAITILQQLVTNYIKKRKASGVRT